MFHKTDIAASAFANYGVKEGDKVIISEYGGTEVKIGDEEYKIVIQDDILAIVE